MDLFTKYLENKFRFDANYFARGGFWLLTTQVFVVLFSFLTSYYLANYLSESAYGNYRYVLGLAMTFGVFSLTGAGQAIHQAISKGYHWFFFVAIKQVLGFGLIITILAAVATAYYFINGNTLLAFGTLLIALFHPLSQLFGCTISYLHGQKKYKQSTTLQAAKSIFVSGAVLLTFYFTDSVPWLLGAYFTGQTFAAIVAFYLFRTHTDTLTTEDTHAISRKYLTYAKHTSFRNMFDGFASRLDAILVFQQLGAAELATYSVAALLPEQIRGSFKNLQTLLVPKYVAHNNLGTMRKAILTRSIQFLLPLTAISALTFFILPTFYGVLFEKYTDAVLYTQLFCLSFPASIYLIPLTALQTLHREKSLYVYNIGASIFQIITLGVGLFTLGLIGVVLSRIATQYFRAIILFVLLHLNHD